MAYTAALNSLLRGVYAVLCTVVEIMTDTLIVGGPLLRTNTDLIALCSFIFNNICNFTDHFTIDSCVIPIVI